MPVRSPLSLTPWVRRLLIANARQFVFRFGLGHEVVDTGFGCDRCGSHRVVARDHDRADAHLAKLREPFADAALDDILELHDAENPHLFGNNQRRAAGF